MLKCKIDFNKKTARVKSGKKATVHETAVETLALVQTIFREIYKQNPRAAELYRSKITRAIIDPESPVWEVDDHGKT